MSETYKEQHPLLCDDFSEEECLSEQRRYRPIVRGRARTNLKGVTAILARWPEHWTTFLIYWWIGLGMITLTTFIVYNSLFAYAMISPSTMRSSYTKSRINENRLKESRLPNVNMHIFKEIHEEINLYNYLPYIEIISNQYTEFKYNLIIVTNDTSQPVIELSEEESNDIALNSLWSIDNVAKKRISKIKNINIQYVNISDYMSKSPLKKHWRQLSHELYPFLLKAISIWDKGGIAFNPIILTPNSPHSIYIDKLRNIFTAFKSSSKNIIKSTDKSASKSRKVIKSKQKVNNIQDIINALEDEDNTNLTSEQVLVEAESKKNIEIENNLGEQPMHRSRSNQGIKSKLKIQHVMENNTNLLEQQTSTIVDIGNNETKSNMLPMFLGYLFHKKSENMQHSDKSTTRERIIPAEKKYLSLTDTIDSKQNDNDSVSIKHLQNRSHDRKMIPENTKQLTIDLKGNILATETPCHAFIGTIFSNVIHYSNEESVTDFIITELSIFCKGLLSSCNGIDLLLL